MRIAILSLIVFVIVAKNSTVAIAIPAIVSVTLGIMKMRARRSESDGRFR